MITHEEAKETHTRLFDSYLYGDFIPFPTRSDLDTIKEYITQQEKKDELLGLYRSVHGVVQSWDTMPDVEAKIQKLEKELKEGSK